MSKKGRIILSVISFCILNLIIVNSLTVKRSELPPKYYSKQQKQNINIVNNNVESKETEEVKTMSKRSYGAGRDTARFVKKNLYVAIDFLKGVNDEFKATDKAKEAFEFSKEKFANVKSKVEEVANSKEAQKVKSDFEVKLQELKEKAKDKFADDNVEELDEEQTEEVIVKIEG